MIGIIGGTSFFHSSALREGELKQHATPYGSVQVAQREQLLLIARHGLNGNVPPHRIHHRAHIWILRKMNVEGMVCFGSVGGLSETVSPGTLLLVDDLYAPFRTVTFHDNSIAVTIPELRTEWRNRIGETLAGSGCDFRDGGVYAETLGLRFETRAEVRRLAKAADVVGMNCASEAILAMELDLPVAILAMVDNYAHGLGFEPLTGERFHKTVRENEARVLRALEAIRDGSRGW